MPRRLRNLCRSGIWRALKRVGGSRPTTGRLEGGKRGSAQLCRTTVPHNCAESVRWMPNDFKVRRLFRSMPHIRPGSRDTTASWAHRGRPVTGKRPPAGCLQEIHREIAGHVVPRYRGRSSPRCCWSSWTGSSCRDRRWDHPNDGANEDRRSRIAGLHLPIGPLDQRSRQSLRSGWLTGRRHDACCRRRRRPRPAAPSP